MLRVKLLFLTLFLAFLNHVSITYAAAPSAPLNLIIDNITNTSITIRWDAPPEPVEYYNIYRHYDSFSATNPAFNDFLIAFKNAADSSITYTDTDVIPGETYYYSVTAVNVNGEESALSNQVLATVIGTLKPHRGADFLVSGNFCHFCHKVHKARAPKKILRKGKLLDTIGDPIAVCYTCHDGTGSQFNIKDQFDLPTTAHNTYLQGNKSAGIKCLNCHHPHGRPPNPRMTHELEENLCFYCHRTDGQNAEGIPYPTAPKVKEAFVNNDVNNNLSQGIVFAHPIRPTDPDPTKNKHTNSYDENADINNDGKAGDGYSSMSASTRHVECTDCHNQHQASRIGTTSMGPLEGGSGVTVNNGTDVGAPIFNFIIGTVTQQYQICFKCHSSFNPSWNATVFWDPYTDENGNIIGQALARGDKAVELNTNNSAFHPVEAAGRNRSWNLCLSLQSVFGLDCSTQPIAAQSLSTLKIKCSDCHNNSDTSGAKGPHGSSYKSIRKANYYTDITGPVHNYDINQGEYYSENFRLCFTCHNENKLVGDDWSNGARTNFMDSDKSLHKLHLKDKSSIGVVCKNCHFNPHSNVLAPNTRYIIVEGNDNENILYNDTKPPKWMDTRLINFSPDIRHPDDENGTLGMKPTWKYNVSTRQRSCWIRCHKGATMDPKKYTPSNANYDVPYPN